jgi:glycogen debranching enzyme
MPEIVEIEDRFYIHVESALTDRRVYVLKEGDTFGVFGTTGDAESVIAPSQGLYRNDTRFLSRLQLRLEDRRPLLLDSAVTRDNARILADYTNPDVSDEHGRIVMARGVLHLSRSRFLWRNVMYERLTVANFGFRTIDAAITIGFGADYADVFEVRGTRREARGRDLEPRVEPGVVTLGYEGLDGVVRRTVLRFSPSPGGLSAHEAGFVLRLQPRQRDAIDLSVACEVSTPIEVPEHDRAYNASAAALDAHIGAYDDHQCTIVSSNEHLGDWADRSLADIRSLVARTPHGLYPHAGVPWYSTPFGRDGIITALEMLWVDPGVARGVLGYLAAMQADSYDPANDAEPGKILHERRVDEMAATGEVPFGRYYGTVDATPLFIILAGEYYRATGDRVLIESLWNNIARAMEWIERSGDSEGDGFVDYKAKTEQGLINQGWKDSHDAISHADGRLATGPIALCEVQGYVYQSRLAVAVVARALGMPEEAERQEKEAMRLRERFAETFWLPRLGTFALALDGERRPCAVLSSNAGHCLFSGIASPKHAKQTARTLMSPAMFSGWGIRTLGASEMRYDPMSYHNGSIWPHDNAIVAAGLARYGMRNAAVRIMEAWFDASMFLELHRLPELFCGFPRLEGKGPTSYPAACSPQAWAAGAVFMMLRACLGLTVDGVRGRVRVRRPLLPFSVRRLQLKGLRVGDSSVDLLFHREAGSVGVLVLGKDGPATVMVVR